MAFTLKELITRGMVAGRRSYKTHQALVWLLQVASALAHLHSQKPPIIHRDVKPENVLLKRDEDGGRELICKLSDLGLHAEVSCDRSVMLRKKSFFGSSSVAGGSLNSCGESRREISPAVSRGSDGTVCYGVGNGLHTDVSPFLMVSEGPTFCTVVNTVISPDRRDTQPAAKSFISQTSNLTGHDMECDNSRCAATSSRRSMDPFPISNVLQRTKYQQNQQQQPPVEQPDWASKLLPSTRLETTPLQTTTEEFMSPFHDQPLDLGKKYAYEKQEETNQQHHMLAFQTKTVGNSSLSPPFNDPFEILKGERQQDAEVCSSSNVESSTVASLPLLLVPRPSPSTNCRRGSLDANVQRYCRNVVRGMPPRSPIREAVSATLSMLLSRHPELVQPVPPTNLNIGLRSVASLLQQLGKTELKPLRRNEMEWVYGLTGKAGSFMYMAPEVYNNQPYNEKSDVFSFGTLAYELLAGEMLIISIFNTGRAAKMGIKDPQGYAARVAEGFRPSRARCVSDAAWSLIESCWHPDPVQRPSMEEVNMELQRLVQEGKGDAGGGAGTKGSRFSGQSSSSTGDGGGSSGRSKLRPHAPRVNVGSASSVGCMRCIVS